MSTQILKEYSLEQIKSLAKNYLHCKIEDVNGRSVTSWNSIKMPIDKHLKECINRFTGETVEDGYYYFLMSRAARYNKDADKYLVKKGNPTTEPAHHQETHTSKNDLLSVTSALNYITQIAELKTENNRLILELQHAKDENAVLSAELEEYEREEADGLNDNKASDTVSYLKETAPTFLAAMDKYFELQDRKLNLEEKKIEKGFFSKPNAQPKQRVRREIKKFELGSDEHLNYIRLLYNNNQEEQMNKEIDKLETAHPEKYELICNELNLFSDDENNNN